MMVCAQGWQHSTHHKSVCSELAFETLTQLGKVDQTVWDGVFFFYGGQDGGSVYS